MNQINRDAVLSLFRNKLRDKAAAALDVIEASLANGEWLPGSRTVKAALNKHYRTDVIAWTTLSGETEEDKKTNQSLYQMKHIMEFGLFERLPRVDVSLAAFPRAVTDREQVLVDRFLNYRAAMLPVVEAINHLDSVRPKPVITKAGLSPTQQKTMEGFNATDVDMAPLVEKTIKFGDGFITVYVLNWPEGTHHHTSRFTGDHQCEACGHGIKTGRVPLLLTTPNGPASFWVGRDCAKRLFAIDIKGVLEIKGEGSAEGQ